MLQMSPQGLTALEMWCLAMIGLVFVTLIAYGIILVQLNVTKNKRHWKLELSMFLILVFVTIIFVIYFFVHALWRICISCRAWYDKIINQTDSTEKVDPHKSHLSKHLGSLIPTNERPPSPVALAISLTSQFSQWRPLVKSYFVSFKLFVCQILCFHPNITTLDGGEGREKAKTYTFLSLTFMGGPESQKRRQRVSNADRKVFENPEFFCAKFIIGWRISGYFATQNIQIICKVSRWTVKFPDNLKSVRII